MNLINKTFISFLLLTIGAASGFYLDRAFFMPKPGVVIKEIEKPIIKYIKVVKKDDTEALYDCYKSPIKIQYKMVEPETMRVIAMDTCKRTEQWIQLEAGDRAGWKTYAVIGGGAIVAGAIVGFVLRGK